LVYKKQKWSLFSERVLNKLSSNITCWIVKPSQRNSGGILVGINDSLYQVLDQWILDYSITVCLKNKADSFIWIFTVVYGPSTTSQKHEFLQEL
jgi:hypothetical protein